MGWGWPGRMWWDGVGLDMANIMRRGRKQYRSWAEGEEHARGALNGGKLEVKGHAAKLEDHDVQRGWKMREEARQRILCRCRIKCGVIYLMGTVWPRVVHVLEKSHRKALERPYVRLTPPHECAVHTIVSHASFVRLVEAASVLSDRGAEHTNHNGQVSI